MRSTRRDFLKSAASAALVAGVASPTLIPRSALADGTRPGANDRVGVAGIGVGRRGSEIFASAARNPKAQAICVADVWLPRAENIAKKHKCDAAYQDYRRVLDRKDVDAVLTATPEHWRGLVCINACLAGKHVYGEKPITLTISEGALMEKAARKNNVVFQTGSQQRSQRQNYVGCEFIRNGGLGQIKEVIAANYESPWLCDLPAQPIPDGLDWETWCGPTPVVPYNIDLFTPRAKPGWLSFRPYSGGEMTGWGTHGFDQIQCALGTDLTMPTEIIVEEGAEKLIPPVYSKAEDAKRGNEICSKPRLAYKYANGIIVRLGNANRGGGIFIGEKGKMEIFRGNLKSNPPEIAEELLKSERRDQDHVDNWLSCILTGERPISDIAIGRRSAAICHLLNIARYLGRSLKWDPDKEVFIGDDEANTYLSREPRKGYELPTV
ncbi:MAG: Gfo/Idh/MocA family oxidoreductase [Thermoguttaceae bacterium]|nr:Gfo/Idh/MocA family oxidoreductase [Thermoguttaceae bacterium]MBQ7112009.1 Gfo/Idh/MocA family oxidoreductase [Thermoguttaceae bacterium]